MEGSSFLESVTSWPSRTRAYVNELKLEMKRVTWPNRKQVEGTTMVVIFTVFAFAAFFAVVDTLLNDSVTRMYKALSR
ncbi:MAG TPA: preprotein translocase subunit SecE [Bryobacteraceae bacterium]|nr:preprotein translocase subunit SecE [Bryobacteraceae bacterium]